MGSLTGAVAYKRVTEAHKGKFELTILSICKRNSTYLLICKIDKSNKDESRL